MKRPVTIGLMFIFFNVVFSCGTGERTTSAFPEGETTNDALLIDYRNDLLAFENTLAELAVSDEESVSHAFENCRRKFKRIEFLLEYMDRERHALFNGPPVVKENRASPGFDIIEPSGLQVLEEMICEGIPDPDDFKSVLAELQFQADLWRDYLNRVEVDRRQWLEAVLIHLVRIETLSLAGFDRPCSGNGPTLLEEIRISFRAISHYTEIDIGSQNPVSEKLARIDAMLAAVASPDDIPLAEFIRNEIQPLRSGIIRRLALVQHSETPAAPPRSFDLHISSLYDPGFLDASFFSAYGIQDSKSTDTGRKVELGRRLFFEPLLSESGPMSCGTCHRPDLFFTDGFTLSSSNRAGRSLDRNTPTLIHASYQSSYMYDARAASLEEQMVHVFRNEMEFNTHIDRVIERLAANEEYKAAFNALYAEMSPKTVNLQSVSDALAAYVRSLTGHNSIFDRYMREETDEIDAAVTEGFQLFMGKGKCATCHFAPVFGGLVPPFFTDSELENIGTPATDSQGNWQKDTDPGRYRFYQHPAFRHFFKTSTVRNTEYTSPYMHNGIFDSLDAVVDFYNIGGGTGAGLQYDNQTLPADSLDLSPSESAAIIAFIRSLTDSTYLDY